MITARVLQGVLVAQIVLRLATIGWAFAVYKWGWAIVYAIALTIDIAVISVGIYAVYSENEVLLLIYAIVCGIIGLWNIFGIIDYFFYGFWQDWKTALDFTLIFFSFVFIVLSATLSFYLYRLWQALKPSGGFSRTVEYSSIPRNDYSYQK